MAKLRIEFIALGSARGRLGGQVDAPSQKPLGTVTLDVTAILTAPEARPIVPVGAGTVFARLSALDVPIYVDIGAPPDPASEPRLLILPGAPSLLHVAPGHALAALLALDVPFSADPLVVSMIDRSGTLVLGGAAQQACPAKADRKLLMVANPDERRAFWFNITGSAANAAGSVQVAPGAAFIFDKAVPGGAVSIYGAFTGQPFTAKEV